MRLLNRWSIRLALMGLALGLLQSYKVLVLPHFMIGFGVPFAIVLMAFGLLIDFSIAKKGGFQWPLQDGPLLSKWSIRLGLLGFAAGAAQHMLAGPIHLPSMIGFGIPYAIVLAGLGMLIDFSKSKNRQAT
jgi:hypothetical protein